MAKKTIYTTKETETQLKEVEVKNGASHSATIRIAVAEYHKKLIKEE
jgi:hypothetical protein